MNIEPISLAETLADASKALEQARDDIAKVGAAVKSKDRARAADLCRLARGSAGFAAAMCSRAADGLDGKIPLRAKRNQETENGMDRGQVEGNAAG